MAIGPYEGQEYIIESKLLKSHVFFTEQGYRITSPLAEDQQFE